jgi:hypothetical protein
LPTTKQAFEDFFTAKVKAIEIEGDGSKSLVEKQINENIAKEYLDALNGIPSSPVDEFISNVVGTLRSKGINIP